jgi:DNA repair exonuclease SbcCD ATPase subunit
VEVHERFEELSAAASIGEASGAELAELQEHMAACAACREAYAEFLQLSAVRTANGMSKQVVSGDEAIGYIDSALLRQKFLKRAQAEGVVFSHPKEPAELQIPQRPSLKTRWNLSFALPLAAACLLIGGLAGGYYWKVREAGRSVGHDAKSSFAPQPAAPVRNEAADAAQAGALARLQEENRKLSSEVTSLKSSLSQQAKDANELEENAATSEKERDVLASELKQRQARIDDLERQIAQSQVELASAKTQLAAQASNEDTVASDQARIRELSDQLAEQTASLSRERDLLSADRDIRELMGARNLHIADVFDTDAKGKTRPTLGRIFFTEGKSLIFYAYDLNDHRVQNAGYNYRVWGKKEGPGQGAKSLGIFYSDDKTQKRWVFRSDDPKVLSEIDSVFVTVEPPGKNPVAPQGDKLLYAYLRNQANHP